MAKGNPHPKPPPPPFGNRNAAKGRVNLVQYAVRIDPAVIATIKELQASLGLKSQADVITLAVEILRSQHETNRN